MGTKTVDFVAILDFGKTNSKLLLVEALSGELVWQAERAASSVSVDALRQLDLASIDDWLMDSLASAPDRHRIGQLVPIAHGAAAILLDAQGQVLAAPDYEDPVFESVSDAYRELRDPYARTWSPFLPLGLNLGRQWFWLQSRQPALFARVAHALLYPQYWAWRLSGVMASEVTSLGCHSDLWLPLDNAPSVLARRQGWAEWLPPLRRAGDVVGKVSPEIARRCGINPDCVVLCGIHDSNAAYLRHRMAHPEGTPFTVVSSGTWTIIMMQGGDLGRLREPLDMLANIDAFGAPVATARFMGGREYEAIAQLGGKIVAPRLNTLPQLLANRTLALPCFSNAGGPFAGIPGCLVRDESLGSAQRATLATLYVALMTDLLLDHLNASGDVIVDGPLSRNPVYAGLLAQLRPASRIVPTEARDGSIAGALCLAGYPVQTAATRAAAPASHLVELSEYRAEWRSLLNQRWNE